MFDMGSEGIGGGAKACDRDDGERSRSRAANKVKRSQLPSPHMGAGGQIRGTNGREVGAYS